MILNIISFFSSVGEKENNFTGNLILSPDESTNIGCAKSPEVSIEDFVICKLCGGYIIDATTIFLCLHSCKLQESSPNR